MGYLIIDHRGGTNPDGTKGELQELDTVGCKHCGAVIRIVLKGVASAYETPFKCTRCRGPICKACAHNMEVTGLCNPLKARLDHAVKVGHWDEAWQHRYNILPS